MTDLVNATKIALVTGAGSGIGLATAKAFAAAGDTVILADIDESAVRRAAAALGARHVPLRMDVSDARSIIDATRATVARFGRIDVLVNNAGIVDPRAQSALEIPLEDIRRLVSVNLEGTYAVAREVSRFMGSQGGGAIVNLSSGAALRALPNRVAYSLSKAAVLGLTRSLAAEWGAAGIRVNAVLPGYVATEILLALAREGRFDPEKVERAIPVGRLAEPEEIAAVIKIVAGATYMTGAAITVDGGTSAFGGPGAASAQASPKCDGRGIAIVIGGVRGLGAGIAARLSADRPVIVLNRGIGLLPAGQMGMDLDIKDGAALEHAMEMIAAEHGPIAVLVNSIGDAGMDRVAVADQAIEFRRIFDARLECALFAARGAARQMRGTGGGAIVNVLPAMTSGGYPHRDADHAARAALRMLTRSLACEWAALGIRMNVVAPGISETDGIPPLEGKAKPDTLRRKIPMARPGNLREFVDIIAFLASAEASYVTGSSWAVDGGLSLGGDTDGPDDDIG